MLSNKHHTIDTYHYFGVISFGSLIDTGLIFQVKRRKKIMGRMILALLVLAIFLGDGFVVPRVNGMLDYIDHSNYNNRLSPTYHVDKFNRSSFPPGFIFGAASAAYQVTKDFSPSIFVPFLVFFLYHW